MFKNLAAYFPNIKGSFIRLSVPFTILYTVICFLFSIEPPEDIPIGNERFITDAAALLVIFTPYVMQTFNNATPHFVSGKLIRTAPDSHKRVKNALWELAVYVLIGAMITAVLFSAITYFLTGTGYLWDIISKAMAIMAVLGASGIVNIIQFSDMPLLHKQLAVMGALMVSPALGVAVYTLLDLLTIDYSIVSAVIFTVTAVGAQYFGASFTASYVSKRWFLK